jgi:exodeoxyribonuclease VII large subunit
MSKQIFTLLQVAGSIRKTLENRYQQAYWVRAELYKMNEFASGHAFPELVQREKGKIVATLSGVLWKTHFQRIRTHFEKTVQEPLSEGKELLLEVKIVFSETFGLSLHIIDIDVNFSLGELHKLRIETLKKLGQEGLLNKNQQLKLPLPKRIALISAESSKGLSDFKEVLDEEKNRFGISTFLFNCTLQGDAAIHSIIDALGKIERLLKHFDAIAIVRGGGAEVGMSCYDDYRLCKKIAEFPLPILCGIGHSTNLTVAEMVANSHAITPSVLANNILNTFEVAASNVQQSALRIQQSYKETQLSNKKSIHQAVLKISRIARWNLDTNRRALNQLSSNVYHIPRISLKRHQNLVMQMPHKLNQSLKSRSNREFQKTQNVWHKIQHGSSRLLLSRQYQLERLSKDLDLLDPKSVLSRGYSIVRKDHTILSSAKSLKKGDLIHVEFYEGKSDAEVK